MIKPERPSDDIQEILDHLRDKKKYLVRDFVEHLGEKGLPFLVLILSLPFMQPIPLPGLSIVLGILIALKGFGMFFKNKLWLPTFILNKSLESILNPSVLLKMKKTLLLIEKF